MLQRSPPGAARSCESGAASALLKGERCAASREAALEIIPDLLRGAGDGGSSASATAVGGGATQCATIVVPAPTSAKPRSSSAAISRSRDPADGPPMITPMSRCPLRTAEAARLKPEAPIYPVLIPSAPSYQSSRWL